jgi:hypothetical protein
MVAVVAIGVAGPEWRSSGSQLEAPNASARP